MDAYRSEVLVLAGGPSADLTARYHPDHPLFLLTSMITGERGFAIAVDQRS